jgi:predicted nucleotide-binding protein
LELAVPRDKARSEIGQQIEKGQNLLVSEVRTGADLERLHTDLTKWTSYIEELLNRYFTNGSLAEDFKHKEGAIYMNASSSMRLRSMLDTIKLRVTNLESVVERLPLIPESVGVHTTLPLRVGTPVEGRSVFVVHGHNEAVRERVSRFLTKLELNPIILHEQANRGMTLIEKFEAHSDVGFAVVLLTFDDVGAVKDKADKLEPRARQNVILELGYFVGKIGRNRVCALYEKGVELPSDYDGVVYVALEGDWELRLGREIKAAEINIDLNKAL